MVWLDCGHFLQVRAGGWGRSMLCSNLLICLGVHWGPTSPERLFQTRTRFLYGIEQTFFKWDPPAFLKSGGTPLKKIRLVHRDPPTVMHCAPIFLDLGSLRSNKPVLELGPLQIHSFQTGSRFAPDPLRSKADQFRSTQICQNFPQIRPDLTKVTMIPLILYETIHSMP